MAAIFNAVKIVNLQLHFVFRQVVFSLKCARLANFSKNKNSLKHKEQ